MFFKTAIFIIKSSILVLSFSQILYAGDVKSKQVLLVNSYNQRMTWVKNILRAVEDELKPEENNIVLHVENMNTKVFYSDRYLESLKETYKVKYKDIKFDLILSSDNNAYDFLRSHRDNIFPGVPVVFCGVNDFNYSQIIKLEKFTGVAESFSAVESIWTALRLHPGTKRVYIINDYLKTGRAWAKTIKKQVKGIHAGVEFIFSEKMVGNTL